MNRGAGNLLGTSLLLAGVLLTLGVILSMVLHDAGVVMLVGLLFGAPTMIFGAVLLLRVNARPYPDDLIATNAGWLWAAPLMGAITLFFYYLLIQAIPARSRLALARAPTRSELPEKSGMYRRQRSCGRVDDIRSRDRDP